MKLLSLFLASTSFAQDDGSDKWVGYDYGSYYGSYDTGLDAKFTEDGADHGRLGNGLNCFTCHGRLSLASAESSSNNAWKNCVDNGGQTECMGDQRSCITEERRRYDTVVEVKAGCKNPEACLYQWRRNERFMPMFHLFGDQSESANPGFFDDECIVSTTDAHRKHLSARSQWESTCRHCCKAVAGTSCNGFASPHADAATGPIATFCADSTSCAALQAGPFTGYSIVNIPAFVNAPMHHDRAHPGEGRNSAPEDKFIARANAGAELLVEQADQLSTEDTDFHNNRASLGGVTAGGSVGGLAFTAG